MNLRRAAVVLTMLVAACAPDASLPDGAVADASVPALDAGETDAGTDVGLDGGTAADAGPSVDAGADGGAFDAAVPVVAFDASISTPEDTPIALPLAASPAGATLTILSGPDSGMLTGTSPVFTYTPAAEFSGTDLVSFRASLGANVSPPATITIRVTPVNDAPVATPQTRAVDTQGTIALTLTGTDVDSTALTFAIVDPPQRGTLSGTPPNVTYSAQGLCVFDSFSFTVSDGQSTSAPALVAIRPTAPSRFLGCSGDLAIRCSAMGEPEVSACAAGRLCDLELRGCVPQACTVQNLVTLVGGQGAHRYTNLLFPQPEGFRADRGSNRLSIHVLQDTSAGGCVNDFCMPAYPLHAQYLRGVTYPFPRAELDALRGTWALAERFRFVPADNNPFGGFQSQSTASQATDVQHFGSTRVPPNAQLDAGMKSLVITRETPWIHKYGAAKAITAMAGGIAFPVSGSHNHYLDHDTRRSVFSAASALQQRRTPWAPAVLVGPLAEPSFALLIDSAQYFGSESTANTTPGQASLAATLDSGAVMAILEDVEVSTGRLDAGAPSPYALTPALQGAYGFTGSTFPKYDSLRDTLITTQLALQRGTVSQVVTTYGLDQPGLAFRAEGVSGVGDNAAAAALWLSGVLNGFQEELMWLPDGGAFADPLCPARQLGNNTVIAFVGDVAGSSVARDNWAPVTVDALNRAYVMSNGYLATGFFGGERPRAAFDNTSPGPGLGGGEGGTFDPLTGDLHPLNLSVNPGQTSPIHRRRGETAMAAVLYAVARGRHDLVGQYYRGVGFPALTKDRCNAETRWYLGGNTVTLAANGTYSPQPGGVRPRVLQGAVTDSAGLVCGDSLQHGALLIRAEEPGQLVLTALDTLVDGGASPDAGVWTAARLRVGTGTSCSQTFLPSCGSGRVTLPVAAGQVLWVAVDGPGTVTQVRAELTGAPNVSVGGTVSGLDGGTVSVSLNGGAPIAVGNGPFQFSETLRSQQSWFVSFTTRPPGRWCTATPNSGVVSGPVQVSIRCVGYRDLVREAGVVAYWPLDEVAAPFAGLLDGGLQAIAQGGVQPGVPGLVAGGRAVHFSGDAGYLTVPASAALNPSGDFSVEAWFQVPASEVFVGPAVHAIVSSRDAQAGGSVLAGYVLHFTPNEGVAGANSSWAWWGTGGSSWAMTPTLAAARDAVHHGVFTYSAGARTGTWYLDGTPTQTMSGADLVPNAARPFLIGAGANEGPLQFFFRGVIDDVAVYPYALGPAEVAAHNTVGREP